SRCSSTRSRTRFPWRRPSRRCSARSTFPARRGGPSGPRSPRTQPGRLRGCTAGYWAWTAGRSAGPSWASGRTAGGRPTPARQRAEGPEDHLRGRFTTRGDGSYAFLAVRPVPYTIPADGPVGKMLGATGRHPWRPAHVHMIVRASGYRTLTTHIFDRESEYLDS